MHHPHQPPASVEGEGPADGKQPGFTLIEFLIAFTLFGIIIASTVGLMMSQRTLYDIQADRMALQRSIRASVDLVAGELRTVPPLGLVLGTPDSISVHYPIQWGLICGEALDGTGAEMFLRAAEDALFADQVQSGYGVREPDEDWAYFEESDSKWDDSLVAATSFLCKEGAGAKFQATTTYNKDGTVNQFADTANVDYPRFNAFATGTGSAPVAASEFIVYSDITYTFGASVFEPGTRALFRNMPGASQELTGLFANGAGFEYVLANGNVVTTVPAGQHKNVVTVRIKALGYTETNASGTIRSLEYDATVNVPLRNVGG